MNIYKRRAQSGFTLVETVIAMGIITIMITAFMAAFGPAVKGISKSISAKEANRLASTLEYELSVLREGEESSYSTAFEKAFNWIEASGGTTKADMILVYQYRGDPSSSNAGTLAPYKGTDGIPGKDYVLQSVVRQFSSSAVASELSRVPGPSALEGRVFLVKMSQLVFKSGALEVGSPGMIQDPQNPGGGLAYDDYPEATIAFQASFYALKSSDYDGYISKTFELTPVDSDGNPKATGKPIFTRNMAVRR